MSKCICVRTLSNTKDTAKTQRLYRVEFDLKANYPSRDNPRINHFGISSCSSPEELAHRDATFMKHGCNELCKVVPKVRYIYGHVLCICQHLFQPAKTWFIFPQTTLETDLNQKWCNGVCAHPLKYCCADSVPALTRWCIKSPTRSRATVLCSRVNSMPFRTNTYNNVALLSSVTHCNASYNSTGR